MIGKNTFYTPNCLLRNVSRFLSLRDFAVLRFKSLLTVRGLGRVSPEVAMRNGTVRPQPPPLTHPLCISKNINTTDVNFMRMKGQKLAMGVREWKMDRKWNFIFNLNIR